MREEERGGERRSEDERGEAHEACWWWGGGGGGEQLLKVVEDDGGGDTEHHHHAHLHMLFRIVRPVPASRLVSCLAAAALHPAPLLVWPPRRAYPETDRVRGPGSGRRSRLTKACRRGGAAA